MLFGPKRFPKVPFALLCVAAATLAAVAAAVEEAAAFSGWLAAQGVTHYDQHSAAIGLNWTVAPGSALKFEWMRTKVGMASALVDGDIHHKSFNVFSMSYNFAF